MIFLFVFYSAKAPKIFTFDHCFYSLDADDPRFVSQEQVFEALGKDLLENAFLGYNACIFAYGQTGSLTFPKPIPKPSVGKLPGARHLAQDVHRPKTWDTITSL